MPRIGKQGLHRIFVLIVLLLLTGSIGVYRMVWLPEQPRFVRAEAGAIHHEAIVGAVFANQEYVLQAPVSGKVSFAGSDGQRFRKGESVAAIQQEGVAPGAKDSKASSTVLAPHGGLLYQRVDGLESLLTASNLLNTDLHKLLAQPASEKSPTLVQAGETFGKIVDNLTPSVAFLALPSLEGSTKGLNISLRVAGKAENAKILRVSGDPTGVVVQFAHFVDESAETRKLDISWVKRSPVNGILIPQSAIWREGDNKGIFVVVEGVIRFREIKILDQDNTMICVQNLPEGMLIVSNPRQGLDGMVIPAKN